MTTILEPCGPRVERRSSGRAGCDWSIPRPFERAEINRRDSVRIYQGLVPIGNGQAPGITTGRGATGAGAGAAGLRTAGLRFAEPRFALRRATFFFFAARLLPARFLAFAI